MPRPTGYSLMRRFCVFCHDELICKMATHPETLTLQVAAACYTDMLVMVSIILAKKLQWAGGRL